MSVVHMPSVPLDASGYPARHQEGLAAATTVLREWLNELPESVYFMNQIDAECAMAYAMSAYWQKVRPR